MDTLDFKLFRSRIGAKRIHTSIRPIYADKTWVNDLDIVNELGGHTGCVNALSWSTQGNLLASGSDDTYLNIWEYNPTDLGKPFTLNTSVHTGHGANIFSVKFMPHSNDRTVISCAGDSEVRVFDLEYSGANGGSSDNSFQASTRSRRFHDFFGNARWLNESNTDAKVYRSHADRAKRIVTESSPYLFLTCSEDGEVRQWDLRQPSSSYPAPSGPRRFGRFRLSHGEPGSAETPPALISYKDFNLDLNSISCSGSQPHYIALGGAHLHCFLHDRRMLGRDIRKEQGRPPDFAPAAGTREDEMMREQTRCVRRFAPNNKRAMTAHDTGHITACKISDARPNELISSWSGDHIYSFDIVRSPDAREAEARTESAYEQTRLRHKANRKRKRAKVDTSLGRLGDGITRSSDEQGGRRQSALRVRYENGDTESISLNQPRSSDIESLLTEAQIVGQRIAKSLVQLRRTLFDFSASIQDDETAALEDSIEVTPFTSIFTNSLGQAVALLPQMDEVIRTWSYPIDPSEEEVRFQNTLRANRQSSWRFVQAAGCLSKTLGGKLQTLGPSREIIQENFKFIKPALHENNRITPNARFCYDFLRAILLWLNGGAEAVLEGFKRPPALRGDTPRYPLVEHDTLETLSDKLRDYLLALADAERPIVDLGTNRFERDEFRNVFEDQHAAVQSFIRALSGINLRWRHGRSDVGINLSREATSKRTMDKGAAIRFWALKVGRSLLMDAAEGVVYDKVQRAYGGPRLHILSDYENLGHNPHILEAEEGDRDIQAIGLVTSERDTPVAASTSTNIPDMLIHPQPSAQEDTVMMAGPDPVVDRSDILENEDTVFEDSIAEEDDDNDDASENDNEETERYTSDSEDDDEYDHGPTHPILRREMAFNRSRQRAQVNADVPYSSHTKVYSGHCNTRTVKDVNYYGLDDEYVVSGSDDGHFFIWDRKTGEICNILEGDGEVVNVVQGHPFEPMIACSGIDSTVKIFGRGDGSRDRYNATRGINIANPGGSVHSSLGMGSRRRRDHGDDEETDGTYESPKEDQLEADVDEEPRLARNGLRSRRALNRQYEITSQNDAMRREGMSDAYMTEGMLARLAAVLQRQGGLQALDGRDLIREGGAIVIDQENCLVM